MKNGVLGLVGASWAHSEAKWVRRLLPLLRLGPAVGMAVVGIAQVLPLCPYPCVSHCLRRAATAVDVFST